jgi:YidC/Oxa1 family membrane protein insertase
MLELLRILIYYPLINLLTFLIWIIPGHFAAVGIILLTLFVRFLLVLPSKKAAQTQRKMQQVQPLIDELKREYGDDKQGLAVAQMELFKKNDINPFSNCLTLLIQIPILITLYYAIRFGLAPDSPHIYPWMVRPEFINTNFFGISLLTPDKSFVLPVIAAILQYIQIKMTMPNHKPVPGAAPDVAVQTQKMFQYVIPGTTLIFASSFPAGVALYWVVSTMFSIGQQWFVNKEKYNITGVDAALKEADVKHPEHKPRSKKVLKEIKEQTATDTKSGVTVTVRKKKSS